jgi:hypothetical protein
MTGVVDENPAHGLGTHGVEVRPTLPVNAALVDQFQEGFMNESRWLKRMIAPFAAKKLGGQLAHFIVNDRKQALGGRPFLGLGRFHQDLRDIWL